jgi:hypothetical protein
VVRVDRAGRESSFVESGRDAVGQVLGLRVDASRRRLWLATLVLDSAAPRHSNGGGGWAFLHAYELPSGRLVARHAAPDSAVPHLLNDLVVTREGDLYVTDTEAHAVYRLPADGARLARVHGGEARFRYPNGIALDPSERRLYVAHLEGISVAELGADAPPALAMMPRRAGVSGSGIDGLYACADRLVAVQGVLGFQQVTAFRLAPTAGRSPPPSRSSAGTRSTTGRPPGRSRAATSTTSRTRSCAASRRWARSRPPRSPADRPSCACGSVRVGATAASRAGRRESDGGRATSRPLPMPSRSPSRRSLVTRRSPPNVSTETETETRTGGALVAGEPPRCSPVPISV